jgi:ABC-type transporter Mla MlaB component
MAKSRSAAKSAPLAALELPSELTIYTVGETHPQWMTWLGRCATQIAAQGSAPPVQGQRVDEVDAAGLQLLLALGRALGERGAQLRIEAPSERLRAGCEALGLADWLQEHCGAGEPA